MMKSSFLALNADTSVVKTKEGCSKQNSIKGAFIVCNEV